MEKKGVILAIFIVAFSILYAGCASGRGVLFDDGRSRRINESFGELGAREQRIDEEQRRLEELEREIENGTNRQNELIQRLTEIIRRIRERNKENAKRAEHPHN